MIRYDGGTIMNVTFIGLGNMGSNIAQCILKAGFDLTVWNRTVSKMHPLVEQGANAGSKREGGDERRRRGYHQPYGRSVHSL